MNIPIDRKKLFKIPAYLIILLFVVNYLAGKFYWYYSIWYFDMLTHFLGGLCSGLIFIWFLSFKDLYLKISWKFIGEIFLGIFLIGISWEIFEMLFDNIIAQNPFNILDTISDIFFDLSGGLCAILYLWKKLSK